MALTSLDEVDVNTIVADEVDAFLSTFLPDLGSLIGEALIFIPEFPSVKLPVDDRFLPGDNLLLSI
jgi:hypothetical protein